MRLVLSLSLLFVGCAEADSTGSSNDGSDLGSDSNWESDDDPGDDQDPVDDDSIDEDSIDDDPIDDDPIDDDPIDDDPIDDDPMDDDTGSEVDDPIINGMSVYNANCRECHGYPSMFATELAYVSDDNVFYRIRYGGYEMPAQSHLSDAEIEAVIAYLR
jgi:hypothetical protein